MRKITIGVMSAAVAVAALAGCSTMNQEWHSNCTVTEKERLVQEGSSSTKRVSTTCGAFDVSDSIGGGFNSYDTWAKLQIGKSYDIKTGGYRHGWASSFPTVLEVREAGK